MILIGGENLIDFIQENDDAAAPLYRAIAGGSPYNTAKAAARQEVAVGYLTPISEDTLGGLLRRGLEAEGVALLAEPSARPSSLAVVSLANGQAAYQFYREGTAERDVTPTGLRTCIPETAEIVYVGSLAITDGADAEAWADLYRALAERGVFTALDPNIRASFIRDRAGYMARLEGLFGVSRLIKLSDEDIAWLAPGSDPLAAAEDIWRRSGADLLVLTRGRDGANAWGAFGTAAVPAAPVADLKDTVGAGDTFMGTLLAEVQRRGLASKDALARIDKNEVTEILHRAATAAAINCGRVGCDPPVLAEII